MHLREGKPAKEVKKQRRELQLHNNQARVRLLQLHLDLHLQMEHVSMSHNPTTPVITILQLGITTTLQNHQLNNLNQCLLMMKRYIFSTHSFLKLHQSLITHFFDPQITELKLYIDSLEKERDFYFSKLRDVEILCQNPDTEHLPVCKISPLSQFNKLHKSFKFSSSLLFCLAACWFHKKNPIRSRWRRRWSSRDTDFESHC